MFLSFDGIDGVGKSTQLGLLCGWLRELGYEHIRCRDPGSTLLGEKLREIVLHSGTDMPIARRTEMLLYMAARAQLVEEVIRPALAAGKVVVSDRYLLANLVYQGYAGGLDLQALRQVGQVATDGILPTAIFLLDMPPEAADGRIQRPLDRMEQQGDEFRVLLRQGFLAEAELDPSIHVIDANRPTDVIHAEIRQLVTPLLPKRSDATWRRT
jgi:dTMP kinase